MDELIGAYDFRGRITVDQAWNIGKALADWLPTDGRVAVAGRQGAQLYQAVIEGLRLQGRDVISLMDGDRAWLETYVVTERLAGGVRAAFDELEQTYTIELLDETGRLIDRESGLTDLAEIAAGGNFVPAAKKGELSILT